MWEERSRSMAVRLIRDDIVCVSYWIQLIDSSSQREQNYHYTPRIPLRSSLRLTQSPIPVFRFSIFDL